MVFTAATNAGNSRVTGSPMAELERTRGLAEARGPNLEIVRGQLENETTRSVRNVYETVRLRESCGNPALPYHTVTRCVKVFREGRDAVHDRLRSAQPSLDNNTITLLDSLLDGDRRWTHVTCSGEVDALKLFDALQVYGRRWKKHVLDEIRSTYKVVLKLTLVRFSRSDVGTYTCVSTNSLGHSDGTIRLYVFSFVMSSDFRDKTADKYARKNHFEAASYYARWVNTNDFNARLHHHGSKLYPRSYLRSTQKTVAPFGFRAGQEIEMKFISNSRKWLFEISIRYQQQSSTNVVWKYANREK
ncbi:hypothetical protein PR048_015743 [Dryococelus australis]|uniref:Ig-like domain-containing protein n=1 Tax=Dryococelus australis TaxID=614101 RepID=A0ABQ9HHS6_9NEOP|nr:hypothetical protein PR048_015743 [Dryococelus australis]